MRFPPTLTGGKKTSTAPCSLVQAPTFLLAAFDRCFEIRIRECRPAKVRSRSACPLRTSRFASQTYRPMPEAAGAQGRWERTVCRSRSLPHDRRRGDWLSPTQAPRAHRRADRHSQQCCPATTGRPKATKREASPFALMTMSETWGLSRSIMRARIVLPPSIRKHLSPPPMRLDLPPASRTPTTPSGKAMQNFTARGPRLSRRDWAPERAAGFLSRGQSSLRSTCTRGSCRRDRAADWSGYWQQLPHRRME